MFDELVRVKQLALLRGDVISHMTQEEGRVVMEQVLDSYLIDSQYEQVRAFNHTPQSFDFEKHTQESIQRFREKQSAMREAEARLREDEQV